MRRLLAFAALLLPFAIGCAGTSPDTTTGEDDVVVDTSTPEARRQYDADVAFAQSYVPRCKKSLPATRRPRVLVTGFGRFMSIENNATGRILSTLVTKAPYPETHAPAWGEIDPPDAQVSVGAMTLDLPKVGRVDVCAMILPVHWDLAAILIAKELDNYRPSMLLMNGVAGERQPLWLELGATNRAVTTYDGSNLLTPAPQPGEEMARLVDVATPEEERIGNLLSWQAVQTKTREAIARHADEIDRDVRFGDIVGGADFAGFPRASNTYLCNNVTYVSGWLMSHPGTEVALLKASTPVPGAVNEVRVRIKSNLAAVPRVFVHWPSDLADKHLAAAADVMKTILAAQLEASRAGDAPVPGDNAFADPALEGGEFF